MSAFPLKSGSFPAGPLCTKMLASVFLAGICAAAGPSAWAVDLLGGSGARPPANAAASEAAAQAAAASKSSIDALGRASQAIQNMRRGQDAARALAKQGASPVPNGLGPGGLLPQGGLSGAQVKEGDPATITFDTPTSWTGIELRGPEGEHPGLSQTTRPDGSQVTIKQNQQKAILTWEKFNVGRETELYFDQTAGGANASSWIALNRVLDPGTAPSQILGSIKAEGQVYVINKNGILFGGASQINTHSLVASSLALSDAQFMAGIGVQRTTPGSGYIIPQFGDFPTNDSESSPAPYLPGDVTVEAGAQLKSGKQGLVALFGSNVTNRGSIETPSGQVLLAAGENVYLANSQTSGIGALIGLEAYVSARPESIQGVLGGLPAQYARTALLGMNAVNDGLIIADEGSIRMVGHKVVQNGALQALTTLNAAGGISLMAHDTYRFSPFGGNSAARAGELILGENSVTSVLIDRNEQTGTGGTAGNASLVRLWGQSILLAKNALVKSEGGQIDIGAFDTLESGSPFLELPTAPSAGARFMMAAGALIDVSGVLDAAVPVARNFVEVEVRANELRDSPLQRDGILKGKKIWVDRRVSGTREDGTTWYGTEVVDANAYIANVPTSMAERSVKGGTVTIHAGEVVMMPDAEISIAGGSLRYLDGVVRTTTLLGADGRLYDIGSAPADMTYVALGGGFTRNHARWGVTQTWGNPLWSGTRFEKGYVEGAEAGTLQIHAPVQVLDGRVLAHAITGGRQFDARPKGGSFTIGSVSPPDTSFNANNVLLQAAAGALASNFTMSSVLPTDRSSTVTLSTAMLSDSGLSAVNLIVNGNVTFAADSDIRLLPGASLSVSNGVGDSITVDGSIQIAGGTVSLGSRGSLTVKADARIDVSGQWTNRLIASPTATEARNGGSITLAAEVVNQLVFENGAVLAADAGATLDANGKIKTGTAGSIQLTGTTAANLSGVTMSAYGIAVSDKISVASMGGKLTLNLPAFSVVSNDATPTGSSLRADFFDRGGFGDFTFNLSSLEDGIVFSPEVQTRILTRDYATQASAGTMEAVAAATTLAPGQRPGARLAMTVANGFVLGADTVIAPGIGGSVSIAGAAGNITIAGKIDAPAGSISINAGNVTLASTAQLLARGATRIVVDPSGLRNGQVLDGGSVSVAAGNWAAGALIDVSGTTGEIDVVNGVVGIDQSYKPLSLASAGGSISVQGRSGLIASTLVANAGGTGAAGGTLRLIAESPAVSVSAIPTTVYYQDANGAWQARTNTQDLDILNQFPGAAITSNSVVAAERTKVVNATRNGSGGLLTIINDDTLVPGGAGWETYGVTLQEIDPTLLQNTLNAVSLYNSIYYSRSGSGTAVSPFVYTKLNYSPVITELAVRQSAFQHGGFADVALQASKIGVRFGDGVDIAASRRISVTASLVTNFSGASARLTAPLVTFDAGRAAATATNRAGAFSVHAQQIDVSRAAFKGFADISLDSAGDLIMSGSAGAPASLYADGALNLSAGQIYPTTQTPATITATHAITVDQNGTHPVAPLSAGGKLTLAAPTIVQNGTLLAPFGQITLDATSSLTLGPGSLTSVSGAGLIVPYGRIVDEVFWYADNPNTPNLTPPEKRITLKAPTVDTQAGAVIDLSGGGDLMAYEFIPGSGGSSDYLTYGGATAIMPVSMVSNHVGKRIIHLDGGNGIPAGDYVVLPASYALLPGAYRLVPQTASNGQPLYEVTRSTALPDGSVVVAGWGYTGGTDIRDQRTQAFRIASLDTIKRHSEYKIWTANDYFRSNDFVAAVRRQLSVEVTAIPRLPMDAGALQIQASLAANLAATLNGSAALGGRGAAVDVAAGKIAVTGGVDGTSYRANGYLVLDAAQLSAFGAESLLLGGTRQQTVSGLEVDATASSVVVATDGTAANALVAPEILLASEDAIQIADGSLIEARGTAGTGSGNILIRPVIAAGTDTSGNVTSPARDYGAFVRVSNGAAVRVIRDGAEATQGTLTLGAATLSGNAIILDATKSTTVSGGASLLGRVLDVTSSRVSIGTPTGTPQGLVLAGGSLDALLGAADLRLRSYSSIDFYGDARLGALNADGSFKLGSLLLDAAGLNGSGAATVSLTAGEVTLSNTRGGINIGLGGAGGNLTIEANNISLGGGSKEINGFASVQLSARAAVVGRGAGTTDFRGANVSVSAPLLTAESGASQNWTTTGVFSVNAASGSASHETLGAQLAITAAAITQAGLIDLTAGVLTLRATSGDVTLAAGSTTRARGFSRTFYDQEAHIAGGTVALLADQGAVRAQAGSLIDVSATGSGEGGTISISTPMHAALLDGDLRAGRLGSFSLDAATVSAFGTLSAKLAQSGFDDALHFRLRSGDVILDGVTKAREFKLVADQGAVTIAGMIDARTTDGGSIEIYGSTGLTLGGTARLLAGATHATKGSGRVTLGISGGRIDVQSGARIDVAGGEGGKVRLRAPVIEQAGADTVNVTFAGTIADGASEIVLEAYKRYNLADLAANPNFVGVTINGGGQAELDLTATAAGKTNVLADYGAGTLVEYVQDFDVSAAYGNLGGLAGQANFHARPGMQLDHTGDIVLKSNWNLGAGIVDQTAALNAGVMGIEPFLNKAYVVAGKEGELLANHTKMIYRTGGSIFGEAGVLTLRAQGDLVLKGSITDGFFQFGDSFDPDYLAKLGSSTVNYALLLNGGFNNGGGATFLTSWASYTSTTQLPSVYMGLSLAGTGAAFIPTSTPMNRPYSAAANSPAALGSLPNNTGDALKYADVFPRVTKADGGTLAPPSWDLALVAGAAPAGQSPDPLQLGAAGSGSVILEARPSFSYTDRTNVSFVVNRVGALSVDTNSNFGVTSPPTSGSTISAADWISYIQEFSGVSDDSTAVLALGPGGGNPAQSYVQGLWNAFAAENGLVQNSSDPAVGYRIINSSGTNIVMAAATFASFYNAKLLPNLRTIEGLFSPPAPPIPAPTIKTVTPSTIVRTGTGSITVAAAHDVVLADQKAVIYTAGARVADPTLGGTYTGSLDYSATNPTPNISNTVPPVTMPVFTEGGGDVTVTAQNDVKSLVASDQMIVDWLWRDGATNSDGSFPANRQTAWWINFSRFEQGVAALGGGSVSVAAGRDIVNVSAFTPTQGRVGGGRTFTEAKTLAITGGGDLSVGAARDIVGGVYYVDKGTGSISAGGAITSNRIVSFDPDGSGTQVARNVPIRTMLGLGDAALKVTAGGTIDLGSASNPTMWDQADYQFAWNPNNPQKSTFSTYGERTDLELLSVGGDVSLWNQAGYLSSGAPAWASYKERLQNGLSGDATVFYPGSIKLIAAAGDVTIRGGMAIWPSAIGNVDLWAQENVTLLAQSRPGIPLEGILYRTLVMSPANPERLGTPLKPLASLFSGGTSLDVVGLDGSFAASNFRDGGLLHANDYEPSRIYANGDINAGTGGSFYQYFAEQTWFRAGRDINNIRLAVQNNHASDLTLFQAGRDINLALGSISIDGPGFALVEAGRDIYLGKGLGIQTRGNGESPQLSGGAPTYRNPYLPRKGADLVVMSGTADGPRYNDFIAAYLDPANIAAMPGHLVASDAPIYGDELTAFMRQVTGDATLSATAAFAAFRDPRYSDYRKILIDRILSRELRAAGRGQLEGLGEKGLGYERGYAALAKLFPGADQQGNTGWQGDIIMDVSMIRSYLGGDLDIVVPGGKLQVSALSSRATGDKNGVLTINGGEIRITTGLGTIINTSRVLTARGGDITIWATFGDIDAGKGRKSSLTNPPRTYKLSADGDIVYEINPSFTGSGISTQKGAVDAAESDVDLYAPSGTINAGDAGIRVSGNVYLGALQILGTENISAGGEIKGLPEPTQSAATLTVEAKNEGAAAAAEEATHVAPNEQPSIIIVEVIGYGGGDGDVRTPEHKEEERRKSKDQRSYNPDGAVQILGHGDLSDEEKQPLNEEERGRL
ncbi:filamentous hemagglutinin N-terminal domain-containing protein [Hyphomicrobium sp. xq]|uniref:Filamentous hemagglutinin N-terminal domain-containing protein n=1 Tax=Hyphomicrobium album TaxID=2665159 RepID=A0A6I3KEV7_9HYPH|nr:filamentous haemagglutinin family protein [Hyphomicrobium album]MTD92716.1 filamentous hemagglutinin N-terminal domain-containing protein [Hyphomicrobium album]